MMPGTCTLELITLCIMHSKPVGPFARIKSFSPGTGIIHRLIFMNI